MRRSRIARAKLVEQDLALHFAGETFRKSVIDAGVARLHMNIHCLLDLLFRLI